MAVLSLIACAELAKPLPEAVEAELVKSRVVLYCKSESTPPKSLSEMRDPQSEWQVSLLLLATLFPLMGS